MNTSISAATPMWSHETGEEAWLESEMCHHQMLRALPVAVCTCDAEGRVTFFNRAAARLWGREPALNKDLWCGSWKIFQRDGTPMPLDQCPMARTIREGRSVQGEEVIIERMDGTRRRMLAHPEPIRNSSGAVVGAVNTLVDLTGSANAEWSQLRPADSAEDCSEVPQFTSLHAPFEKQ